ncbi:MAG: redox-regulated ATPase YchF [Pelagibacteraceae bacterium]|nr:redox-regulated ATPase YchF [Pelagibacteraceae bacterium]|tara:strand:+ start:225 stop:1322 length:1098 start_codon:yes stop_codon:yes gene_type:complete
MGFSCGIVGLPNVGKSTLFNALTNSQNAKASNYAFCTIEPNKAIVEVPDNRLTKIGKIENSKNIIPTQLNFIDIAGLVKGASKGEGLGNKFLSHIKEVDLILHVIRCFDNPDIDHIEDSLDPIRDMKIIEEELILSDLVNIEEQLKNLKKNIDKEEINKEKILILEKISQNISLKKDINNLNFNKDEIEIIKTFNLISTKPKIFICNLSEKEKLEDNKYINLIKNNLNNENPLIISISAEIESQIAQLENKVEKKEFLKSLGWNDSGLDRIIKSSYIKLDLITYFTAGEKETKAWTIKKNTKAPDASAVIHTDFKKGFICAETTSYDDYIKFGGLKGAKENGKIRQEGKEYLIKDGDVVHFLFNI